MDLTVIVPVLNEGLEIEGCLASIRETFRGEVIVVDGGSQDDTVERALKSERKVFHGPSGLANQCNFGAARATGDVLLLVAADVRLPPGWPTIIQTALQPSVVGGGFRLNIAGAGLFYQLINFGGNFRARFYGITLPDQGLFVRREVFEAVGGMSSHSLIPFAKLCLDLAAHGDFRLLPQPATSSPRKWERHGRWATTWRHAKIFARFCRQEGR